MHIRVKKGLDIPIKGCGETRTTFKVPKPKLVSLNLNSFPNIRFKLLVKLEEHVKIGQPIVENKAISEQYFVAPASGRVVEIRRGLKRRLLDIVIEVDDHEELYSLTPLQNPSKEQVIARLLKGGAFPHIHQRPFNLIANPQHNPRDIFVQAAQTLPFVPSFEQQVKGYEELFKSGIEALKKIAPVHLVYASTSHFSAFTESNADHKHTVEGPHPASNLSIAIREVGRVKNTTDFVWTLDAVGVLVVGSLVSKGEYFTRRILSFSGEGVEQNHRAIFEGRAGFAIAPLLVKGIDQRQHCFISGDPLTGVKIDEGDFLEFHHLGFSVLPISQEREPFHFLGLGRHKYSATKTYLSYFCKPKEGFSFTTNQHGEHRAFVDSSIYEKVMPLDIPTMHLVKALLAKDYELAEKLGGLEVIPEDFALPQFICPSKVEMMEIVEEGLSSFAKQMGH